MSGFGDSVLSRADKSFDEKQQSESGANLSERSGSNFLPKRAKSRQTRKDGDKDLQMMMKAIAERPQLDSLTREERIREKLKFFNLEKEDLQETKERINLKVRQME